MAIHYGVLSRYVVDDYVASGYVEGQPIDITSTVTATGSRVVNGGVVVSATTSTVAIGYETTGLDNIIYSWNEAGSEKYSWDNWFLTDQTWEQKGIIFRQRASVTATGGRLKLAESLIYGTSSVDTDANFTGSGVSFIDSVLSNTTNGTIIRDAQGLVTGEVSVVALGGFLRSASATFNISSVTSVEGLTQLSGNVTLSGVTQVDVQGNVTYVSSSTIPATAVVRANGINSVKGSAEIDLGSVVVVIGSATPVADPYRTATPKSETRNFKLTEETRNTIISSETRIIVIPEETRTIKLQSETRTIKVPVPPFVSKNIRSI